MSSIFVNFNREIYYLKLVVQYVVIGMLCYQAHLGLRDSDKSTFENRSRETIKFLQANHPGYRMYMIEKLGIDQMNCTKQMLPNLVDLAPMYVLAYAQWGVLAASITLLNSRLGCILSMIHAFIGGFGLNMHSLKEFFF